MLSLSLELNDQLGELLGQRNMPFLARMTFGFPATLQFWVSLRVTPKRGLHVIFYYNKCRASWEERILKAKVVTVSQEEEWDQIEPLLRRELKDFPVLGIDCEWVSEKAKIKHIFSAFPARDLD